MRATGQDATNYGPGLLQGRGNLTSVKRYNVNNYADFTTSRIAYNTAGSQVFTRDALGHQVTISYADSFSDNVNRNTLAYPTALTNAAGTSSTTKYNYAMGVVTSTRYPTSGTGSSITYDGDNMLYDSAGRLERVTNNTNGAYTLLWYPSSKTVLYKARLLQAGVATFYTWDVLDGTGRVRATLPPTTRAARATTAGS